MRCDLFSAFKSWFDEYTRSFLTGEPEKDGPLQLKIDHTARVCSNIRLLAKAINLHDTHIATAETIGLFHDIGRFEQYRRYWTFNDSKSVNHAALGVKVLEKEAVLNCLANGEQRLILDAIRFHNAPALPSGKPPLSLLFMRLIRDADKLDIWKVFGDYTRSHHHPVAAIVQHLSDRPVWEASIIDAITQKRMAKFSDMKSLNDFKLLQLSWVYDLNFPETFAQAEKRGDLAAIARSLPDAPAVQHAVDITMERLEKMGRQAIRQPEIMQFGKRTPK